MSNKLKDYLHLYIGCECIADGNRFKLHGVSFTDTGTLAYDGTMIDGIHQCWWIENCDFKLILRPLSDIRVKEIEELGIKILDDKYEMLMDKKVPDFTPDQFVKLLSFGFDLFNLIASGDAIDKTKMK